MPTTAPAKLTVTAADLREFLDLEEERKELESKARKLATRARAIADQVKAVLAQKRKDRITVEGFVAELIEDGRQSVKWMEAYTALAGPKAAADLKDAQPPKHKLIVKAA